MTMSGMNESFTDETAQLQAVTKFLVQQQPNTQTYIFHRVGQWPLPAVSGT